jgi:RNA polymerase sigma-70 factor (ECF subfamily)
MAWRDRDQHEWRGLAAFRAWLLGIARNRIRRLSRDLSAIKRGGHERTENFSALAGSQYPSVSGMLPPGSTTPSQVAGSRERVKMMQDALASLPPKLEPVVRLRLFEEVPMRSVAEQLGIGLSTAKERLLRGVQLYRRRLRSLESMSAGGEISV